MVANIQTPKDVDIHFFVTKEEAEDLRERAYQARLPRTQYIRRALGFDKPEPPTKKGKKTG